ncbi:MAG TPA: alkaline phosphatase family protein [Polyangia bacterium]|nr:alkaline phosphatase family protein [Polyangia bacterium]
MRKISRRQFLKTVAGAAAVGLPALRRPAGAKPYRPAPQQSGIKHIIVLMMENRSFDHFLGWLPGADGMQEGLIYTDRDGVPHSTYPLAPDYQGCGHPDPDHSYEGGRVEYNDGRCDGWLRAGDNDVFAIGYYTRADLPFLAEAARSWTTCDRYFSAIMAPTYPNRFYQHCAVTDRLDSETFLSTLPTIWDRLAARGLEGRYYFSDVPFLSFWGDKYLPITRPYGQFLIDCALGDLPHVSFVDPRFGGEEQGLSNDDHPHADIRAGEWFLDQTYRAITRSPAWKHTVLVINFDEWGGFFDHVPPPSAPDVDPALELRGFRVPCLLVSPFARRGYVSHNVYDHTSILKMIEWRWNLAPLSVRDAYAANLADELVFTQPDLSAPDFAVPPVILSAPCAVP